MAVQDKSDEITAIPLLLELLHLKLAKLVRGELDWIVMKCLEKDRSRRYDTANGLERDVERYLADEVVEAQPPSAGYRLRKLVRRKKGRVLAGGLLATMLFMVIGLILYGVWWSERQSAERRHEQALSAARKNDDFKATLLLSFGLVTLCCLLSMQTDEPLLGDNLGIMLVYMDPMRSHCHRIYSRCK